MACYYYVFKCSFLACCKLSLFYADDCLWGPWKDGHCNCVNETKTSTRKLLRNAAGCGLCKDQDKKIETCNCTGE